MVDVLLTIDTRLSENYNVALSNERVIAASPMVAYMKDEGWSSQRVKSYCRERGWAVRETEVTPIVSEQTPPPPPIESGSTPPPDMPPANFAAPSIADTTPQQGETINCSPGTWFGALPISYSYQWFRAPSTAIGSGSSYTLVAGDLAASIYCRVTATNAVASVAANSNTVGPVTSGTAPVNTAGSPPTVTGTAQVGLQLTSTLGSWTGTEPISYARQWFRAPSTAIGTGGANYSMVTGDIGFSIYCRVTATNSAGSAFVDSNTVGPVTGGTWTPASLSGLIGWWKADVGVTQSAGVLSAWLDQSGNAADMDTTSTWPTYNATSFNGLPGIIFNGVYNGNHLRAYVPHDAGNKLSIFMVMRKIASSGQNYRFGAYLGGVDGGLYNDGENVANPQSAVFLADDAAGGLARGRRSATDLSSVPITIGENCRLGSIYDGTNHTAYNNNAAGTPVASSGNFNNTVKALYVGCGVNGGYADWCTNICVSEIVVTKTAISLADRASLDDYFKARWGFVVSDAATNAWETAVVAAGGTVSSTRKGLVDALITGLKADGVWTKLDRLWLFAAENPQSALRDLKATAAAGMAAGAPAFTVNLGYSVFQRGGTELTLNFNPTTNGVAFTQNSAHVANWSMVEQGSTNDVYTGIWGSSVGLYNRDYDGTARGLINSSTANNAAMVSTAIGFLLANRSGINAAQLYKNGVNIASDTGNSAAPPNASLMCDFGTIGCVSIGGSLNSTEQLALYNRLRTYMTAVGVP